jgi:uncharacterized repeat protein (TIGR01451 family)
MKLPNKKSQLQMRSMRMKVFWNRNISVLTLFLTGFLFLAGASQAQQGNAKLDLKTTAEKEVMAKEDGKVTTTRVPVDNAHPGDVVVYTISYSNTGKGPVLNATITDPLPSGVRYVADTAEGKDAEITFSVDNGQTWHAYPVMVTFKKPDGSMETKPAAADSYTHIKWTIKKPVAPGQSGQVRFKVTVK